jgi:predicted RNA-binding protein with PIN domain
LTGVRWLVDGMNVIGSRPDGWWRDRPGAMNKLVERLRMHVAASGDEMTVVFDGRKFPGAAPNRVSAAGATVLGAGQLDRWLDEGNET